MKTGPIALVALLLPLLLASSAFGAGRVDNPLPPPAPGQARIVAYRTAVLGPLAPPAVLANDLEIGRASVRGYFHADLAPGRYTLAVATERSLKLDLQLEADHVYYVSLTVSIRSGLPRFEPEVVDEATAKKDLEKCHPAKGRAVAGQTSASPGQTQPAPDTEGNKNWLGLEPSKAEPYRRK